MDGGRLLDAGVASGVKFGDDHSKVAPSEPARKASAAGAAFSTGFGDCGGRCCCRL